MWIFFKRFYLFIFRQRGREGGREGEKHQCLFASCMPPTGALTRNPGMCPDWELNQRPFGLQGSTQSTEPLQPGPKCGLLRPTKETSRLRPPLYAFPQSSILDPLYRNALFTVFGCYLDILKELPKTVTLGNWQKLQVGVKLSKQQSTEAALLSHLVFWKSWSQLTSNHCF